MEEEKEFNLKEKMNFIHCQLCDCNKYECFSKKDVEEFIRRLKDKWTFADALHDSIDKLSGGLGK